MLEIKGKLVQIIEEVSNDKLQGVAKGICSDAQPGYNNLDLNVSLGEGKRFDFYYAKETGPDSVIGYIPSGCGRVRKLEIVQESTSEQATPTT